MDWACFQVEEVELVAVVVVEPVVDWAVDRRDFDTSGVVVVAAEEVAGATVEPDFGTGAWHLAHEPHHLGRGP